MKIVIGDKVFNSKEENIVIKFSQHEKDLIKNMPKSHFYFGIFKKGTNRRIKHLFFIRAGWKQ